MEFRLLGPLEVVEHDRVLVLGGGRQRALFAMLLLHANEVVSADRLIDGLWGQTPPATAGKIVQVYVSRLRKQLGNGRLVTRSPGYLLRVDRDGTRGSVSSLDAAGSVERATLLASAMRSAGRLRAGSRPDLRLA